MDDRREARINLTLGRFLAEEMLRKRRPLTPEEVGALRQLAEALTEIKVTKVKKPRKQKLKVRKVRQ